MAELQPPKLQLPTGRSLAPGSSRYAFPLARGGEALLSRASVRPWPYPSGVPDRDATTTLVPCLACEGHFRTFETDGAPAPKGTSKTLRVKICAWCLQGAMTPEQVAAYRSRPKRASGELTLIPSAVVSPPLATCSVCGAPIVQASKLALGDKGYRCTTCPEPE